MPGFDDEHFDLVWSLEIAIYLPYPQTHLSPERELRRGIVRSHINTRHYKHNPPLRLKPWIRYPLCV